MTEQEALYILSGKLVFGDQSQIDALGFLRRVATCMDELRSAKDLERRNYVVDWWLDGDDEVLKAAWRKLYGRSYQSQPDD